MKLSFVISRNFQDNRQMKYGTKTCKLKACSDMCTFHTLLKAVIQALLSLSPIIIQISCPTLTHVTASVASSSDKGYGAQMHVFSR